MVAESTLAIVRRYLDKVAQAGIPVVSGVVYGSFARGEQRPDSDLDLLVVSSVFDGKKSERQVETLWHMTWRVDSRIEPIPVGVREFEMDEASPLIGIARREGVVVKAEPQQARMAVAEERAEYRPKKVSASRRLTAAK